MWVPKIIDGDALLKGAYDEYQEVKVVQDDDGHNYVIPAERYNDFSEWLEMKPYYENDENLERKRSDLDDYFSAYRTGGDLNLKLYAKVGYEKEESF